MHHLFTILLIAGFLALDQLLGSLSSAGRWVVFFPIEFLRLITERANVAVDYQVLLLILLGIPLTITYWFAWYRVLCGREPVSGQNVAQNEKVASD